MFRAIDLKTEATVNIENSIIKTECPDCGKEHEVDLEEMVDLMRDLGSTWADMKVCCAECTQKRQAVQA